MFDTLVKWERNRHEYAKEWKERTGGKVLGYFQVYFPEELAHAAGMLPFKVRGAAVEPTHSDSRFGSYLCSIIKTSLEELMDTEDALEGLNSFLEKRQPTWKHA